jgi:hypothetical protein
MRRLLFAMMLAFAACGGDDDPEPTDGEHSCGARQLGDGCDRIECKCSTGLTCTDSVCTATPS